MNSCLSDTMHGLENSIQLCWCHVNATTTLACCSDGLKVMLLIHLLPWSLPWQLLCEPWLSIPQVTLQSSNLTLPPYGHTYAKACNDSKVNSEVRKLQKLCRTCSALNEPLLECSLLANVVCTKAPRKCAPTLSGFPSSGAHTIFETCTTVTHTSLG